MIVPAFNEAENVAPLIERLVHLGLLTQLKHNYHKQHGREPGTITRQEMLDTGVPLQAKRAKPGAPRADMSWRNQHFHQWFKEHP